jgi:hypothetical protein
MTAEELFAAELEVFRTEVEGGMQFLFSYLAVHTIAARNRQARTALNACPLFWNTALAGLQLASFVTLGRIFDQSSKHNVDALFRAAQGDLSIFSKDALAARKRAMSENADEWLPEYLRTVHVPRAYEFRALRKRVNQERRIYERTYRAIRHHFAHKNIHGKEEVQQLFSKTQVRELERLYVLLYRCYQAFWQLFMNGRKLAVRPMPYSIKSLVRRSRGPRTGGHVHEEVVRQTSMCLELLREGNLIQRAGRARRP